MMENEIKYDMGGSTSPKELKGYRVRIFTNNSLGSAQNIVSNGKDSAILVTDGKTGDSSTVMSNEPYLLLSKMEFRGRTSISAKPVNYGNEGKHKMFGGAFVWSSDSRFRNDVSEYPVPLHDRVEYKDGGNISEENQSKIAKLEKVVASTMVPDAVKEQAKAEIERLRSETSMGGEENNMKNNNSELNKEVFRIVNKINDKDSFEQIVSEVLTDANYHPEAFKFASLLDKTIKTKEDWYKSDRFVADDENRTVALKISNLTHWDADYFGPALEFALKMKGFHRIAEALEKALSTDATNNYPNAIDEITKRQTEYAQDIANRTGLRQGAVAEFIAKNGLNEKETLNLLQGLGMKKLDPRDFMTAVTGVPNNEYETKIVAFAKSNEAFKTPEPLAKPTPKAISKGNLSSFARYISKRNIKSLVAEIDGQEYTFSNSDIVDGVYVLKENIKESKPSKKTPKVTRTQFEEEEFEFGKGGGVDSNLKYKIGDKIKSFEVKKIVDGYAYKYDKYGKKTKYITEFLLLLSDNGQERILRADSNSLSDAERYYSTFGKKFKYKTWNMLESPSNMAQGGGIDKNIQVKTTNQIIANDIMKYADLQNVEATQTKSGRNYIINLSSELEMRDSMTAELKKVLYPNQTIGWKHKK